MWSSRSCVVARVVVALGLVAPPASCLAIDGKSIGCESVETDRRVGEPMSAPVKPYVVKSCSSAVANDGGQGNDGGDFDVRYLLLPPTTIEAGRRYPLVLFLHGAGERGVDLSKVLIHLPRQMIEPEYRDRFPCFFVVPQCPEGAQWVDADWGDLVSRPMAKQPTPALRMAMAVLDHTVESEPIDRRRIYLTGMSMGGYGAWEMAIRRPERFAAMVAVCGGGDETRAGALEGLPIWATHGVEDNVVPVERTRRMVQAVRQAGGDPRLSEFPGVGHDSWSPTYALSSGILDWLFRQVR